MDSPRCRGPDRECFAIDRGDHGRQQHAFHIVMCCSNAAPDTAAVERVGNGTLPVSIGVWGSMRYVCVVRPGPDAPAVNPAYCHSAAGVAEHMKD